MTEAPPDPSWWSHCQNVDFLARVIVADNANQLWKGRTPLMHAASYGHVDSTAWLLQHGGCVRFTNHCKWTALHFAEEPHVIRLLIKAGADVEARERMGWTPLAFAIANNQTERVRALIDAGAKVENVHLGYDVPDWVMALVMARKRCRSAALLIVGIRRFCRSSVVIGQDRCVVALVARAVWETRLWDQWRATNPTNKRLRNGGCVIH